MAACYEDVAAGLMSGLSPGSLIVDIGGGEKCSVAGLNPPATKIVAVDISEEELARNTDVDEKVVADVSEALPFGDASVGMVVSKHTLEHLRSLETFARESYRVLRPGGWAVHFFPSRFAPFAVANRVLPAALSGRLVHRLLPETAGRERFPAYYDHCHASGFRRLLSDSGFEVTLLKAGYYGAAYFGFLVPLYLAVVAWEVTVRAVGLTDLAASLVVAARRPEASASLTSRPARLESPEGPL